MNAQCGLALGLSLSLWACGGDSDSSKGPQASGAVCSTDSKLTYEDDIKPIADKYCITCHATSVMGDARHDAPADHNFETEAGIIKEAHHVDMEAASGPDATNTSMPPAGYPAPSKAERAKLGEWLACNADVSADDDD